MTGETTVRVRYAETDQMGIVYHANYLVWFEVGRVELMRSLGLSYKSMEEVDGANIAVVEATCRYKAPARYDDVLTVRTHVERVRGSVVEFGYQIRRTEDGMVLCQGKTTHITVRQMKRCAMPARFAEAFERAWQGKVAAAL